MTTPEEDGLAELDWAGWLECEGELEGVAVGETTGTLELEVCRLGGDATGELETPTEDEA